MKKNKILRKLLNYKLGIAGAIFIGALGSGFWEKLLWPALNFIGINFIRLMNWIFSNYRDSIYKNASDGFHEFPSTFLLVLSIFSLILLHECLILKYYIGKIKNEAKKIDEKIINFTKSKIWRISIIFISTAMIVALFVSAIRILYTNEIITYSEKSMNIINPYINENERLILKSNFFRIESAKDFEKFKDELESIADMNNIKLPKVDLP